VGGQFPPDELASSDLWFREGVPVPDPKEFGDFAIEALLILGGVTKGGSGVVITPGGPHPVGPWDPLRPETREVLKGMALAELAPRLVSDPTLRGRVEEVALDVARQALDNWKRAGSTLLSEQSRQGAGPHHPASRAGAGADEGIQ
jgi:hypothetical protein